MLRHFIVSLLSLSVAIGALHIQSFAETIVDLREIEGAHSSLLHRTGCPAVAPQSTDGVEVSRGGRAPERTVGIGVGAPACAPTVPSAPSDSDTSTSPEITSGTLEPFDTANEISLGPGECQWRIVNPPPPANDAGWQGNDPATGSVISRACNGSETTRFMAGPNPVLPPPPPDPAVLAQQAYSELTIPIPTIGAGPDRTKLAVNLWTWLWIDDPGAQTVTVAAGGVSVTATATLSSVTWSLGEPGNTGGGYSPGPALNVTCQGTGTPPPADYDWKAEPPCGHMFHWRSLRERTGGTGTWPITATTTWTVTWASNTGVTGGTTLNATTNDALDVAEYRIVLVGPGG